MITEIKSIDTFYNGNYFRSRLEARWAHFFDEAGIKYEYEPTGFTNGNDYYLPDFYLPEVSLRDDLKNIGVYVEIKHEYYNYDDFNHRWLQKNLCLFMGLPINHIFSELSSCNKGFEISNYEGECFDIAMKFRKCFYCSKVKIEYSQEGSKNSCPYQCENKKTFQLIGKDLYRAALCASKIRFEHK